MKKTILAAGLLLAWVPQAFAGATNSVRFLVTPVPALDEVGLIGLSIVVGIAAGLAARRRKKK